MEKTTGKEKFALRIELIQSKQLARFISYFLLSKTESCQATSCKNNPYIHWHIQILSQGHEKGGGYCLLALLDFLPSAIYTLSLPDPGPDC